MGKNGKTIHIMGERISAEPGVLNVLFLVIHTVIRWHAYLVEDRAHSDGVASGKKAPESLAGLD